MKLQSGRLKGQAAEEFKLQSGRLNRSGESRKHAIKIIVQMRDHA